MTLKERAHQLYAAKCRLLVIYTYRDYICLIDLVSLANASLKIYMRDKSTVDICFIDIWGTYKQHPQYKDLEACERHTQTWRYDTVQFLYADNDHILPMNKAKKLYSRLCNYTQTWH